MSRRRIEALRRLAERPGTEAEGRVAAEMLARHEAKAPTEADLWDSFRSYLRTGSNDDLADACYRTCTCACGASYSSRSRCANLANHSRMREEIRKRFPRGTRVYYNKWAYTADCVGTVTGYSVKDPEKLWEWIRIKFDHLSAARSVPIYSVLGWHLSTEPLTPEQRAKLREGMEEQDNFSAAVKIHGRYAASISAIRGEFGERIRETLMRVWGNEAHLAAQWTNWNREEAE